MKCELDYKSEDWWTISIEPENETEKCALEYLATRPISQVKVLNTRLGLFEREEKK